MLIKNVKIVNYNEIIENANVEINQGIITKISILKGVGDKILIPGFVDVHIHGYMNNDNMDSIQAIEAISFYLKNVGVTSFLPTIMTDSLEKLQKCLENIAHAKSVKAQIIGAHLEGPFISKEKKGAHNEKYLLKPTKSLLVSLIKSSNQTLKKITIAPEIFSDELIKFLLDSKIQVSIGHTNACAKDVHRAAKLGVNSTTHLWNAMSGVANRNPGTVEGIFNNDSIYAELICDLFHVDEETIKLTIKTMGIDKVIATTDALKISGMPDGDSISGGLEVTKKGQQIVLKNTNILAGSAITMHDNFKNIIHLGYDLKSAVALTSFNAAQSLKLDNIAFIKEGKQADLILINNNLEIEKVWIKGE